MIGGPHATVKGDYYTCPRCNGMMVYHAKVDRYHCTICSNEFDASDMQLDIAIWVQGNGVPIFVKDMETTHIQYTINKILNDLPKRTFMLPHLVQELAKRREKEAV